MRGRPKKSNELKKLQGTYRKSRDKEGLMLESLKEIPHHPDTLNERGQKEWYRVVSYLVDQERLPPIDLTFIEIYCIELQDYFHAIEQPQTQESPNGYEHVSPWNTIAKNSLKHVLEIANRFGFTPAGRLKFPPKEKKELNPFELLNQKYNGKT